MRISDQDSGGSLHLSLGIRLSEALADTFLFGSSVRFKDSLSKSPEATSKETSSERLEEQPEERVDWQARDRPTFESPVSTDHSCPEQDARVPPCSSTA